MDGMNGWMVWLGGILAWSFWQGRLAGCLGGREHGGDFAFVSVFGLGVCMSVCMGARCMFVSTTTTRRLVCM